MKPPPSVEVRISGVKLPFPYTFIVGTRTIGLETFKAMENVKINRHVFLKPLKPNDHYSGRTAPLTSKGRILYFCSTNIGTEYLNMLYTVRFFPLQNAVCFIILKYLVPVLFTFYI